MSFFFSLPYSKGNFKKKFGIKRERVPFVFTPDWAYVMGGRGSPYYIRFVAQCMQAHQILRKNSQLFINLLSMVCVLYLFLTNTDGDFGDARAFIQRRYNVRRRNAKCHQWQYEIEQELPSFAQLNGCANFHSSQLFYTQLGSLEVTEIHFFCKGKWRGVVPQFFTNIYVHPVQETVQRVFIP